MTQEEKNNIDLQVAWEKSEDIRAQAKLLLAESDEKFNEADSLLATSEIEWMDAVFAVHGDRHMKWQFGKCILPTGETFLPREDNK